MNLFAAVVLKVTKTIDLYQTIPNSQQNKTATVNLQKNKITSKKKKKEMTLILHPENCKQKRRIFGGQIVFLG